MTGEKHKQRLLITQKKIKQRLSYDPKTGIFTWKINRTKGIKSGDIAGTISKKTGYRFIGIDGCICVAHRLAWLYQTGEWPSQQIDHINGIRDDNRFANLRLSTQQQNAMNRSFNSNNTSGYKGVHFYPQSGKWRASIRVAKARISLGLHTSKEEAANAYNAAAKKYFGEFMRGE